ncbi:MULTISPECIES: MipA/OmpV family protein [unclassified Duganella]|uniref:MipA/OmpV family protein n=1 Tax=unclassified Duganella TaxID=2636909 RepID=UPI0008926094|nr:MULTISPECIES: MipA/OmpV family protein [unclassified Duganella]SDF63911.1 outer membrane protein [Duganella sp. OV458]SDI64588.1 outer membrane protein [Duganella sp. OV510]
MKLFTLVSLTLLAGHGAAFAADDKAPPAGPQGPRPGWGLGVGVVVSSAEYAGEDRRVIPVPLVTYESERFFWRGISGGVHLFRQQGFTVDATLSARFSGIDKKDFGVRELAERGINRDLLEDRKDSVDIGLAAGWNGDWGKLDVGLKADAGSASKGFEGSVKYGYPIKLQGTRITPHAGVSVMSKKMANYYYGTLGAEVARGVVDYKPGSAVIPVVGIDVMHPLNREWMVIGGLSYRALPGKLKDSPLVEKDTKGSASLMFAVSRSF